MILEDDSNVSHRSTERFSADPHNACCGLKQAGNHQHQRALPAAAWTDYGHKLARLDIDAEGAKSFEGSPSPHLKDLAYLIDL